MGVVFLSEFPIREVLNLKILVRLLLWSCCFSVFHFAQNRDWLPLDRKMVPWFEVGVTGSMKNDFLLFFDTSVGSPPLFQTSIAGSDALRQSSVF